MVYLDQVKSDQIKIMLAMLERRTISQASLTMLVLDVGVDGELNSSQASLTTLASCNAFANFG